MESDSLAKLLFLMVAVFSYVNLGVESLSESALCTTPYQKQGLCVPIDRCQNLYRVVTSPFPAPSKRMATYIEQAACTLPNVKRSICCQLSQVVEEEITPAVMQRFKADLSPEECGHVLVDRIARGNRTLVFDYPWLAVLQYDNNGSLEDLCGGSLISKRYVLTAAHCLKTRSAYRLVSVRLGEHTKNQEEDCNIYLDNNGEEVDRDCADPPEDYAIESFFIHPDYNRPRVSNDIGLIRLKKDVAMQEHIKPICLPVTPELRALQLDKFIVAGWGTAENATGSQVVQEATMFRKDNAECQQIITRLRLKLHLSDKQICAGGRNDIDACRGDSGGPLGFYSHKYNGQTRFVQFGVVSSGVKSCGMKSVPGIYTRVSSYMDWILDSMKP